MSQHSASSEEDARRHAAVEVYLPENQAQNVAVSEGVGGSSVSASSAAPTEASLIAAAIAKLSPELAAMAEDKHRKAKSSDPGWKYGFWPDPRKKEFIQCIFCKKVVPTGKCNLFNGEWIPNPSGPAYTNASCRFIDDHQNCMMNGRPDKEYLRWKWKPYGCDLPPFDAVRFLDSMRNKAWGLIGDSILRNQVQSLLCLLSKAEEPVEVYHDKEFKNRRWHFQSYNFTVSIVWAPFLIKSDVFENENGVSTSEIQLHLDILDASWTSQYESFDYIIISGGQWFLKTAVYWENGAVVGCHNSQNKNLAELGFEHLYRKTLQNVFNFIISAKHKPVVFFRTWSPDHFENGEWFNGGSCYRELPYKKGEYREGYIERVMRQIELESFNEAVATLRGSVDVDRLRLMDTYSLSFLRPDGHVGPYRTPYPFAKGSRKSTPVQNDCLHWCVPGPIDAWNDLVMKMALDR